MCFHCRCRGAKKHHDGIASCDSPGPYSAQEPAVGEHSTSREEETANVTIVCFRLAKPPVGRIVFFEKTLPSSSPPAGVKRLKP